MSRHPLLFAVLLCAAAIASVVGVFVIAADPPADRPRVSTAGAAPIVDAWSTFTAPATTAPTTSTSTTQPPPAPTPPTPPTTSTTQPPPPPPPPPPPTPSDGSVWYRLADCESGEWDRNGQPIPGSARWHIADSVHEGGLQFAVSTWDGFKPAGYPDGAHEATPEQQIVVAERVKARQGWGAWPTCSRKLGLR